MLVEGLDLVVQGDAGSLHKWRMTSNSWTAQLNEVFLQVDQINETARFRAESVCHGQGAVLLLFVGQRGLESSKNGISDYSGCDFSVAVSIGCFHRRFG